MSTNRYTQVNWQSPMSNYVAPPLGMLQKIGEGMQKNYQDNIDESYKLNDLLKTIPVINDPTLGLNNVKIKSLIDSKYAPRLEQLTNKIINQGDMNSRQELNNLKREFTNDPLVNEAFESYNNYKAYKEDLTKKAGKYDRLLDDYYGTKLYDDETGLKPFRYHGMEDSLDIEARFSKAMDSIKDDIKGWDVEHLGPDGIKIGSKGKQAGVTADKVMGVAKSKVNQMLTQTDEGRQFVKKLRRLNPEITNEQILQEGINSLFTSATEQIGMEKTSGNSVDVTSMWNALHDDEKKKESFNRLPMQELGVSNANGELTNKSALSVFGLGDYTDDQGNFEWKSSGYDRAEAKIDGRTVSGADFNTQNSSKVNQDRLTKFYTGLLNSAKSIGLPIPKLKNGSTDFDKLKSNMIEYGKHQLINGQVGQGLQAQLSSNMTSYYGGDINEKGEVKLSPFMETAKIKEIGTNNTITTDDDKRELVKNGVIKDINFYAEQPGTVVMTSDDGNNTKNYDVYLGEKVLKELTRPTWELTKGFEKNSKMELKTQDYIELVKNERMIGNNLIKNYSTVKNPKLKEQLIKNTEEALRNTATYKTVSITNSAETDENGRPKYIFIGKQSVDENNKPVEKVIAIDKVNGSIQEMDLNEVQSMESSFIQSQISESYKKNLK